MRVAGAEVRLPSRPIKHHHNGGAAVNLYNSSRGDAPRWRRLDGDQETASIRSRAIFASFASCSGTLIWFTTCLLYTSDAADE